MLASAVSTYINRYAVRPGERAVVFTNNDSAYQAALDLANSGAAVVVVDSRAGGAGGIGDRVRAAGITVFTGHVVSDVVGRNRVRGARIASWSGDASETVESTIKIDCDLLAVSGGWNPAVHLHSQAGGRNSWDEDLQCFVPGERTQDNVSAGACNGK
jgi:sarcosine oxidase subunit alpha